MATLFRPPIIITIRPKPKAREEWTVNLSVLFSPNPAIPFNQDDWPSAARVRLAQKSDDPANLQPLSVVVVVAAPFNQEDWTGVAAAKTKAVGEPVARSYPLFTPNPSIPFDQDLWERAAPARKAAQVDTVELLLPFFGIAPFTGLTETRTTRRQSVKSDIVVNLLPIQAQPAATIPFSQDDWPSAVGRRGSGAKVDLIECIASLFTPNPDRPFIIDPVMANLSASRSQATVVDASVNLLPIQGLTPPPTTSVSEWIIRARRRGRR